MVRSSLSDFVPGGDRSFLVLAFGLVLWSYPTAVVAESAEPDPFEPKTVETSVSVRGLAPTREDQSLPAGVFAARSLGYTAVQNVQIGITLGIGGSLDERVLSRTELFTNLITPLGARSIAYLGLHGGMQSYWIPGDATWLGMIGAQLGLKQKITDRTYAEVGIAYSSEPSRFTSGAIIAQAGLSWLVGRFP